MICDACNDGLDNLHWRTRGPFKHTTAQSVGNSPAVDTEYSTMECRRAERKEMIGTEKTLYEQRTGQVSVGNMKKQGSTA